MIKTASALAWWTQRTLREKALAACSATALLVMGGDALLTAPLAKRVKRAQAQVAQQQAQLVQARAVTRSGDAKALSQAQQEARLRERLQTAQKQAQALRRRAAEATQLPQALRAVIATVGSAQLLSLQLGGDTASAGATGAAAAASGPRISAAAAAASAPANDDNAVVIASGPLRMYRLPITLTVSGSYEELQLVMTQIERHAESLQWNTLALDGAKWPAIQLTLKAHVLSLTPRWGDGL